jgi:Na+-driven multidrug efflux pump
MTSTGILNVILNLFFVMVVGLSVEGVALATAIANLVSGVILFGYLVKNGDSCKISFKRIRISRDEFFEIARIGFPAGIQSALFSLSNMLIQSSILEVNRALTPEGSAYAPVIKGNSAASDLENFIFQALAAITAAASAFTAQNVGAKKYNRVRRAFMYLIFIACVLSVSLTSVFVAFRNPLLSCYGVKQGGDILSELAYDTAMKRIIWKWTPFFLFAIMNACSGAIRGLGKSSLAALISFFTTCVFRVIWIYTVFKSVGTLESIYLSYPVSWIMSVTIFLVLFFVLINRKIRENSN